MVEINSTFIWQVINFLVLLWLLKRYLYGPITEMLDKRSQKINSELDEAAEAKKEAQKLKEKYETELKEARNDANEIIENAENRAKRQAEKITEKARIDAEKIRKSKLAEIERAKKEAAVELRNEVAAITLLAAGKVINEQINQEKHEQLIEQYINSLDQEKLGEVK